MHSHVGGDSKVAEGRKDVGSSCSASLSESVSVNVDECSASPPEVLVAAESSALWLGVVTSKYCDSLFCL